MCVLLLFSSLAAVLLSELRVYELHLSSTQQRLLDQFESAARDSRRAVIQEEREKEHTGDEEYMRAVEANMEREIDAQRRQLIHTLGVNREAKLQAYQAELRAKMAAFTKQQQAASATQPQSTHAHHGLPPADGGVDAARDHQRSIDRLEADQLQRVRDTAVDVVIDAAAQDHLRALEENHQEYRERERLEKEQYEKRIREAEEQRQRRIEVIDAQARPQPAPMSSPPPAQRYESAQRVESTPLAIATSTAFYRPTSSPIPIHMPHSSQPTSQAQVVSHDLDPEAELRRKWNQLHDELHSGGRSAQTGPATDNSSREWRPIPSSSPSSSPYAVIPPSTVPSTASHLQQVRAPNTATTSSAADDTHHTLAKLESALEMDWSEAWEELSRQPPPPPQPQPPHTHTHSHSRPVDSTQPYHVQATPSQHQARPLATPMTEKMSKAIVPHTVPTAGVELAPHPHPHASPLRSLLPAPASGDPAQLLQHASGLFHETLSDLEAKAAYLQQIIQTFKQAEAEMKQKVEHQQQHQPQTHTYQQPQHQTSHFEQHNQRHQSDHADQQYESYEAYPSYSGEYAALVDYGDPYGDDSELVESGECGDFAPPDVCDVDPPIVSVARPIRRSSSVGPTARAPKGSMVNKSRSVAALGCAHPTNQRMRTATHTPATQIRSASNTRSGSNAAPQPQPLSVYPPRRQSLAPNALPRRKSDSVSRPIPRPASASVSSSRPSISSAPAALSYPRPRTASAKAALQPPPKVSGVRAARARIRAIVDKTRVRSTSVSVLSHPHPSAAFIADPGAKGGLRQASVQEVLRGARDIAQRKSIPPAHRPTTDHRPQRNTQHDQEDIDFTPSTAEYIHQPATAARAAREQRDSVNRLASLSGSNFHAASTPVGDSALYGDVGVDVDSSPDDFVDLNTTAGLISQEEAAQARHDGHLEEYLRALSLPTSSAQRHIALSRLAAKAADPPPIYSSPLRTHPSQRPKQVETFSHRADAIVRGSHANNQTPDQRKTGSAQAALNQIIKHHNMR